MTELSMVLVTLTDGVHSPENVFICFMFILFGTLHTQQRKCVSK